MKTFRYGLGGRTFKYPAKARPTSIGSGSLAHPAPFLERTASCPFSQSMSSSSKATISPARRPRRASRSKMAKSRFPLTVDRSQAASTRWTASVGIYLGGPGLSQLGIAGTAAARSDAISPRSLANRKKDRNPATTCAASPRPPPPSRHVPPDKRRYVWDAKGAESHRPSSIVFGQEPVHMPRVVVDGGAVQPSLFLQKDTIAIRQTL